MRRNRKQKRETLATRNWLDAKPPSQAIIGAAVAAGDEAIAIDAAVASPGRAPESPLTQPDATRSPSRLRQPQRATACLAPLAGLNHKLSGEDLTAEKRERGRR